MRTLVYTCTAKDKIRGTVCVHCAPAEFEEIKQWLDELDLGLKYTGQGLPAISAQVLLLLVKRGKSRKYPGLSAKMPSRLNFGAPTTPKDLFKTSFWTPN